MLNYCLPFKKEFTKASTQLFDVDDLYFIDSVNTEAAFEYSLGLLNDSCFSYIYDGPRRVGLVLRKLQVQ